MKQVLLVEDDERLSSLICQYLTENDFIVHRLSSGENLLQHVQTSPPDILLLDVMLPGENGFCEILLFVGLESLLFYIINNNNCGRSAFTLYTLLSPRTESEIPLFLSSSTLDF